MNAMTAENLHNVLTRSDILRELEQHSDGLTAMALTKVFVDRGFATDNVQRVIQNVLDTGEVGLGAKMHLRVMAMSH